MTPAEAAILLGELAALDGRTVAEAAARAWAKTLPDVTLNEALEAIPVHRRQSVEWIMPAHILRIVHEHRRARHEAQQREARRLELEAGNPDHSAEVADLLDRLAEHLGPADPTVLQRREWVERKRRRDRANRPDAQPNPLYWARAGLPPPELTDPPGSA